MSFRLLPMAVRDTLKLADDLGAKLPAKARADLDSRMGLIKNVGELSFAGTSIADAVNNAILAKIDPSTSPEVIEAVTRDRLATIQGSGAFNAAAENQLFTITMANLDEIFDAFKPAFDAAGAELAEAHSILTKAGIDSLEDPRIQSGNLEVAAANVRGRVATDVMRRIQAALDILDAARGKMGVGPGAARSAMTIDSGNATATDLRTFTGKITPWDALTAGYTLSLANPTEQRERLARAQAADIEADQQFERERLDGIRSMYSHAPRQ